MIFPEPFKLTTSWIYTLGDAQYMFKRNEPDEKYMKRMKIEKKSSMRRYIRRKKIGYNSEDRQKAKERREKTSLGTFCEWCNVEMFIESSSASISCPECATSRSYQDFGTGEYREGVSIHSAYMYKTANHYKDHLRRVQGIESTSIPNSVMEDIKAELLKSTKDLTSISKETIREVLHTLKKEKYYNHEVNIWAQITGQTPPRLTNEQESDLTRMFEMVEPVWQKIKPKDRNNMLSYSYLLNKFCLLLNEPELAKNFKLLRSPDKLKNQDEWWKSCCKVLNFQFMESDVS